VIPPDIEPNFNEEIESSRRVETNDSPLLSSDDGVYTDVGGNVIDDSLIMSDEDEAVTNVADHSFINRLQDFEA